MLLALVAAGDLLGAARNEPRADIITGFLFNVIAVLRLAVLFGTKNEFVGGTKRHMDHRTHRVDRGWLGCGNVNLAQNHCRRGLRSDAV